ncbi:phage Gp19/Gp15/Gp42 family protein [Enterococcus gallinarum]|uniref:phage Gp19/Gp15/Gp42 family protein n=1 Tax=Enterococcus gallinarum TaxID=1353 RepID=UPI00289245A1|nr:phage Gp19/Gp15/Gp42 family protein [Enterococcus gallinarum]MDT2686239.1 phage Gp19/Gp15/Gp42 family protein [Enterococcus gallinarum]
MAAFATIEDLTNLWRALKPEEIKRAEELLEIVSDSLRMEADKVGKNLDTMISMKPAYFLNVVKSVTVDVVARTLMTSTDQEPMTQYAEGALGYSVSGSYLVPGGGLFIKNSELSRLGLRQQRMGVIEPYGTFERNNNSIGGFDQDGN